MKKLLLILAVVTTASGCTLAPKYTRPGAEVPRGLPHG